MNMLRRLLSVRLSVRSAVESAVGVTTDAADTRSKISCRCRATERFSTSNSSRSR